MAVLPIIHHPSYTADTPENHRFPMRKFARLAQILIDDGLVPTGFHTPKPITRDQLLLTHTTDYVDAVLGATLDAKAIRKLGFPLTPAVILRAQLATGGTLLAARLALEHGIACNSAGGSHHAHAGFGAGFCVFNDVAVAIGVLLQEQADLQIMVLDLDVHHGDGTASIFTNEPRITTFSLHCDANWPLEKPPSDCDVALPAGTGDDAYLTALTTTLSHLLSTHEPDLVFYVAGVDPHEDDRLGKLKLTDAGLRARERFVVDLICGRETPLVTVLGGGYSTDLDALARRHSQIFHACADWLTRTQ